MVYASNQVFCRIDRSTLAVYRNETYLGDSCLRPGIDIPVETESDIARTVTLVEVQYGIVLSLGNPRDFIAFGIDEIYVEHHIGFDLQIEITLRKSRIVRDIHFSIIDCYGISVILLGDRDVTAFSILGGNSHSSGTDSPCLTAFHDDSRVHNDLAYLGTVSVRRGYRDPRHIGRRYPRSRR